jgi:hypothetical protein
MHSVSVFGGEEKLFIETGKGVRRCILHIPHLLSAVKQIVCLLIIKQHS